jgi:hypothetical protein
MSAWHKVRVVNGLEQTKTWLFAKEALVDLGDWLICNKRKGRGTIARVTALQYYPQPLLHLATPDGKHFDVETKVAKHGTGGWWGVLQQPPGWSLTETPP